MHQLDRRLHIPPGPAFQAQQAVRRIGTQLLQLAQGSHLVRQAAVPLGSRRRGACALAAGSVRLRGCRSGPLALFRAATQGHALGLPVRIRGRGALFIRCGAALPVHFDGQFVGDAFALGVGHLRPAVIAQFSGGIAEQQAAAAQQEAGHEQKRKKDICSAHNNPIAAERQLGKTNPLCYHELIQFFFQESPHVV